MSPDTVDFLGERFRIADERVSDMLWMRYARVAKTVQAAGENPPPEALMESMATSLDILEQCIHADDWARFEQHATATHGTSEQFWELVGEVMAIMAQRPTGRSTVSSDGPQIIEASSTDDSSSPAVTGPQKVIKDLNDKGRPDLARFVRIREEALSTS